MDATQSTGNIPAQQDSFGVFVTNPDHIAHFNATHSCICGDDEISDVILGRFHPFHWCPSCHRKYAGEEIALSPETALATSLDGLVHACNDWDAFSLLAEQDTLVRDYIECNPRGDDGAWLWARDGLFIGYLLFRYGHLRAMVIAEGYRDEGHGTAFLETWYDQRRRQGSVDVLCSDDLLPFYEQTAVPFTQV